MYSVRLAYSPFVLKFSSYFSEYLVYFNIRKNIRNEQSVQHSLENHN